MPDIHSLGSTSGILPCTPVWCGYDYPTQRDRDTFQHTSVSELTNRFLHRCAVADEGLRTQDAGGAVRGRDSDNPAQPPCQPGPRLKEDGTRRTERRMSPATLSRGSGRARIGFTRGLSKKTHTQEKKFQGTRSRRCGPAHGEGPRHGSCRAPKECNEPSPWHKVCAGTPSVQMG